MNPWAFPQDPSSGLPKIMEGFIRIPTPIKKFIEEAEKVLDYADKNQLHTWWTIKELYKYGVQWDFFKCIFFIGWPWLMQVRETAVDHIALRTSPWGFFGGLFAGIFLTRSLGRIPLIKKIKEAKGFFFGKRIYLFPPPVDSHHQAPNASNTASEKLESENDEPIYSELTESELREIDTKEFVIREALNFFVPMIGTWGILKLLSVLDQRIYGLASPYPSITNLARPLYHPQIGYYVPASQSTATTTELFSGATIGSSIWTGVRTLIELGLAVASGVQGAISATRLKRVYVWINERKLNFQEIRDKNPILGYFLSPGTASFLTKIAPDVLHTGASIGHAMSLRGSQGFFYDSFLMLSLVLSGFVWFRNADNA